MFKGKIFATFLILLDLCASGENFIAGDWKRGIYWIAASVLTGCVTY